VTEQLETPATKPAAQPATDPTADPGSADIHELMRTFTVFDNRMAECPRAYLERVRTECPVGRSEMFDGYWVVTGLEPMRQVLGDPRTFSSTVPIIPRLPGADLSFAIPSGIDPPLHTQYRRLLGSVFSRKRIAALEPALRDLAGKLCDEFLATEGPYDFKNRFATTLPCATLLAMLGLPYEDLDRLLFYKDLTIGAQFDPDPAVRERFLTEQLPEMIDYFKGHIDARWENPDAPDDFLTALCRAQFNGERPLEFFEIVNIVTVMIGAGLDTTTGEMCLHMAWFAENQDRWRELIDDPSLIPGAVEELLRVNGLVTPGRLVMKDVQVGGQQFREGDLVASVTAAASFDEAAYPDANRIDFRRNPKHMTFGWGPHLCVGKNLARQELTIAYQELTRRVAAFRIAEGTTPRRHAGIVLGIENLELEVVREPQG
jgi:cytochrome P450